MTTIDRLCLALDAGDDEVLPILADALEEAGDVRAMGLRRVPFAPHVEWTGRFVWWSEFASTKIGETRIISDGIYREWWDRLAGGQRTSRNGSPPGMSYPTRSAAYLALAEVLALVTA